MPTAAADFALQIGVPPQVVDVDNDADERRVDAGADVVGLGHRVDGGAAVRVERMQRLGTPQLYSRGLGMGQHGLDPVPDLAAADIQGLTGHGAADENDQGRAEGGGLVDGAAVVVEGFLARRGRLRREEAAPAQRDDIPIPAARIRLPAAAMSRPSRASLQTVMAATPWGTEAFDRRFEWARGLVVIVWMQSRFKSICWS